MKNKSNKPKQNNASSGSRGTSSQTSAPASAHPLVTPASNVTHRETLTNTEGLRVICFACYVDHALQNTIAVLAKVSELQKTNGKTRDIEHGVAIAQLALEELLEELRMKHHGEGLPQGGVPVRPIPFPLPTEDENGEESGQASQK